MYNSRIEFGVHDAFKAPAGVGLLSAATIPSGVDLKVSRLALPIQSITVWLPPELSVMTYVCVRLGYNSRIELGAHDAFEAAYLWARYCTCLYYKS